MKTPWNWLASLFKGTSRARGVGATAKLEQIFAEPPEHRLIGVTGADSAEYAGTLAFAAHEVYGWKVATLHIDHFLHAGITAMLDMRPGTSDAVLAARFDDCAEVVREALEGFAPDIWLRVLDNAMSRLPGHVFIVHGVFTPTHFQWVRDRGGFMIGDCTLANAGRCDFAEPLTSAGGFLEIAVAALKAMNTISEAA